MTPDLTTDPLRLETVTGTDSIGAPISVRVELRVNPAWLPEQCDTLYRYEVVIVADDGSVDVDASFDDLDDAVDFLPDCVRSVQTGLSDVARGRSMERCDTLTDAIADWHIGDDGDYQLVLEVAAAIHHGKSRVFLDALRASGLLD